MEGFKMSKGLKFEQAYELLKRGDSVRLPEWVGYWKWENDTIMMHCKDGRVLDIREMENTDYTIGNILRNDWETVEDVPCDESLNIRHFAFGEAIRKLKAGKKVARKGWNGKGMYLFLLPAAVMPIEHIHTEPLRTIAESVVGSVGRPE